MVATQQRYSFQSFGQVDSAVAREFVKVQEHLARIDDGTLMHWRGNYEGPARFQPGDVVLDAPWLMCANKPTAERPAPQNVGDPFYDMPDSPAFAAQTFQGVVRSGAVYTINTPVIYQGLSVLVPEVTAETTYNAEVYLEAPDGSIAYQQLPDVVLSPWTWITITATPQLIPAGYKLGTVLAALNSGSDTSGDGGWQRAANTNSPNDPGLGGWSTQNSNQIVRINKEDLDQVFRGTELASLVPGSSIEIVEVGEPSRSQAWLVSGAVVDQGAWIEYPQVVYSGAGPGGEPTVGAPCTITWVVPVPNPTKYAGRVAGRGPLPAGVTEEPYLSHDGVEQVWSGSLTTRVLWQEVSLSPDWDYMAGL